MRLPHNEELVTTGEPTPSCLDSIVKAAGQGENHAQAELHRMYDRRLRGLIWVLIADHGALDDVVQNTWIKAFRGLRHLRDVRLFEAWFFRLGRNAAIDHLRRRKAMPFADVSQEELTTIADHAGPDVRQEVSDFCEHSLRTLSIRDQALLRRLVRGDDYGVIATESLTTVCALKVRVCRLRQVLRATRAGREFLGHLAKTPAKVHSTRRSRQPQAERDSPYSVESAAMSEPTHQSGRPRLALRCR